MLTDEEIMQALQEEAAELPPELPRGITLEASVIAQRVEIADMTELELHVLNSPVRQDKPDSECELGSCENDATYYCTFLSGTLFFGCAAHVDELVSMGVAKKKKVFERE